MVPENSIWKPLRGPLRDWPLALCNPRSVDPKDLQARDTVKRESFIETYQVHHVPSQKWYYISDQMPEEAWVFLQADSSPDGMLGKLNGEKELLAAIDYKTRGAAYFLLQPARCCY